MRQCIHFPVEAEPAIRMKLRHEDNDHLFFRINRKRGVVKPSPLVFAGRAEFGEWSFDSVDSKQSFGLGFGIDGIKTPLAELGSPGEYKWGGFYYTAFSIDPKEQMIVVFMAQLHPNGGLSLDRKVDALAHQAIME